MISPTDFFNFFNFFMKYQNLDLAATTSLANILMRYRGGFGIFSDGILLPMILYSFNYNGRYEDAQNISPFITGIIQLI